MITVGITGNVASGKTTVAERWRDAGVPVIDADAIGHAVLAENEEVQEELVKEFGGAILDYEENIDRRALREKAFASPEKTAKLNAIVHPPLLERLDAELTRAREEGRDLAAVDAALVFEFHLDEVLDRVVLVTAPRELRMDRLRRARGLGEEEIERIMAAQLPDDAKAPESDYVIVNDGTIDQLRDRADVVLEAIRQESETREEEDDA
ncbi:MAG: dephospho-CoA kinase [Gemmatimonadota bacterium]|nr:dephospho-CoA kinase [Gemmatimonadota bacterium]